MRGTNWGLHYTWTSAVDARRPTSLFAYNEAAVKVQKTHDLNKEHKQRAALCVNLFLSAWKGTESEWRAGRRRWGMLGRAPCLLPLECPGASYISPARPPAAPSAEHSQSAATPDFHCCSATEPSQRPLLSTSEMSCEMLHLWIYVIAAWQLHILLMSDLLPTIIAAYTAWGFTDHRAWATSVLLDLQTRLTCSLPVHVVFSEDLTEILTSNTIRLNSHKTWAKICSTNTSICFKHNSTCFKNFLKSTFPIILVQWHPFFLTWIFLKQGGLN